jgi:hypothetical protein
LRSCSCGILEFCVDPFPHVAPSASSPPISSRAGHAFDTILRGQQARLARSLLSPQHAGLRCSAVDLNGRLGWPFNVFVSRPWHDLFTSMFAMSTNGCIGGTLHHHARQPRWLSAQRLLHGLVRRRWPTR